ncbi:glycosyltransferase [Klebsiella quasipneumoniae]|uniref:glycosyltransferase n=1 Tax=Klebsiella/Raoultella group TaxID=2890311 RepID=UPI000699DB32|nr:MULTISPECIES: glycosyltransferase [Klebsiella/Raoultella group]ELI9017814.1 glycosyltransferase [Klebsiella pneumoniae]MCE9901822.1 glycosyltransferase [Raoultella terrigena]HBV3482594.1 glycosyltransferase [Klebsiella pneumoniae]HDE1927823.1 glycosyltransferase [Klebsiella pneumoniae]
MKISVAMATYNGQGYIAEQLDSILCQTHEDIEVVIVDDMSSDSTLDIIKSYSDRRIKLISNTVNLGVSGAFELAISMCSGEYIALCDQDDIWRKNKLESLLSSIGSASLIYSDFDFIDANGMIIEKPSNFVNILHSTDSSNKSIHKLAFLNSFVLGCSMMFNSNIKKEVLPILDEGFNHDKWIINVAVNLNGIKFKNEVLFSYRLHGNNASIKKEENKDIGFLNKIYNKTFKDSRRDFFSYKSTIELCNRCGKSSSRMIKLYPFIIKARERIPFLGRVIYVLFFNNSISARYVNNFKGRLKSYINCFISK